MGVAGSCAYRSYVMARDQLDAVDDALNHSVLLALQNRDYHPGIGVAEMYGSGCAKAGLFCSMMLNLAGQRGVGVPARRSILGGRPVAQARVPVAMVVLVLEVADDHPDFEQGVPVVAV
jgi:hypothetical protein